MAHSARLADLASDRRIPVMLGLGFASGLPLPLVYVTLSAWLYDAKVPTGTILTLSALTLAYKAKFLWSSFLDRYDCPLFGLRLGRRRGWLVAAQLAALLAMVGVAVGDPEHRLGWTIGCAVALGFAGATGDVVIDGWRIAVAPEMKAVMSSWAEIGWRTGTLAGGAGALLLADRGGWHVAYLGMAALTLPGLCAALFAPEPARELADRKTEFFLLTIWRPIRELLVRLGWMSIPILLLIAGFRMPGYISSALAVPLFKSLHYSNTDIATVTKFFGFGVGIAGTAFAGWLVPRLGMMPSLFIGTFAASASHLSLAWLAAHGDHAGGEFWFFAFTVSIDAFAYAFASIVLITYMSTLCASEMATSQYALLTSIVALPGWVLAFSSGSIFERIGFVHFFEGTALIGLPVALLCLWVWHREARAPRPAVA